MSVARRQTAVPGRLIERRTMMIGASVGKCLVAACLVAAAWSLPPAGAAAQATPEGRLELETCPGYFYELPPGVTEVACTCPAEAAQELFIVFGTDVYLEDS